MLDALFKPKAVALIGASTKELSIGNVIIGNLQTYGYTGKTPTPTSGSISPIPFPATIPFCAVPAPPCTRGSPGRSVSTPMRLP